MKERVRVAAEACTARSAPRCTAPPAAFPKAPPSQRKQASHPWWRWSPRFPACRACDSVRGVAIGPPIALCSHLFFPDFLLCASLPRLRKRPQPPRVAAAVVLHVYREAGTHRHSTQHTQDCCAWRWRCHRPWPDGPVRGARALGGV